MALLNPVHTFIVPFLLVVTVPLALFAGITTTLAFSILSFRVILVYLDIALSLVPQCFGTRKTRYAAYARHHHGRPVSPAASSSAHSNQNSPTTPTAPQQQLLPSSTGRRRRRRPSSVTSVVSAGSTTPVGDMAMGLMPSIGPDRDFEGVGGWRSDRDSDDDTWTAINSRLELPDRIHARNHHRSPSGGPVTPGDSGVLMMKPRARSPEARTPPSPNSCRTRTRTPSASRMSVISMANSDGYFPLAMSPTTTRKLMTNQI
ncbi:hypothetical protein HRG_004964 [Hirsutella rhossiliensis]|uniref:Uncharacterized protein n=1 Tax=Hirsutella rhossiliensis TaxID=111463 RepID=A0A9P8SKX3_9HYPO|nr:uncharacterized protein HRG_04964 [Hirsutella rhossiliensis]KAH0964536.1 hypothetical protein HRG_04964 [Hirsutella rhossiliensis]